MIPRPLRFVLDNLPFGLALIADLVYDPFPVTLYACPDGRTGPSFECELGEVGIHIWGKATHVARRATGKGTYCEFSVSRRQARYCCYWLNQWGVPWSTTRRA